MSALAKDTFLTPPSVASAHRNRISGMAGPNDGGAGGQQNSVEGHLLLGRLEATAPTVRRTHLLSAADQNTVSARDIPVVTWVLGSDLEGGRLDGLGCASVA